MTQPKLPEFVYLVTVDTEWPISAIADGSYAAEHVEREVNRRAGSGNVWHRSQVHVWKCRLDDVHEVDLMPTTTVRASLRERPR